MTWNYRAMTEPVFVFGSNEAGRHGKGAALHARTNHGAIYGQGWGLQGNSFAIPTKDAHLRPLPLDIIAIYVGKFLVFAAAHPQYEFIITPIGCGLAGYSYAQIGPMFKDFPRNCMIPGEFAEYAI
jgi:hypothetical protein